MIRKKSINLFTLFFLLISTGFLFQPQTCYSHNQYWTGEDDYKTWFYKQFRRAVIPLRNTSAENRFITGVLIGIDKSPYVLTNSHFVESQSDTVEAFINSKQDQLIPFETHLIRDNQNLDLALFRVGNPKLQNYDGSVDQKMKINLLRRLGFISKLNDTGDLKAIIPDSNQFLTMSDIRSDSIVLPGKTISFVGFPLGEGLSQGRKNPIYRSGMVASPVQDHHYLIDAMVSHGNSGSPVFIRVSNQNKFGLRMAGLLKGFKSDAISFYSQNGDTLKLPHNSGLGVVISPTAIRNFLIDSTQQSDNKK